MFTLTRKAMTAASGAMVMAAAAGSVALPADAANASTAYSYTNQCGPGYVVIDRGETSSGTVFLTYNSSTKKNCVVTVYGNPDGVRHSLGAWISVSGSSEVYSDYGLYKYYAGPVYAYAPHSCIDWGGHTWWGESLPIGTIPSGILYSQYNSHCG